MFTDKSKFTNNGGVSASYGSDSGLTILGNSTSDSFYFYNGTLPSTFSIEYEITNFAYAYSCTSDIYVNGVFAYNHIGLSKFNIQSSSATEQRTEPMYVVGDKIRAEYDGTDVKFYLNNVLKATIPKANSNVGFKTYKGRSVSVKNMKIKPL